MALPGGAMVAALIRVAASLGRDQMRWDGCRPLQTASQPHKAIALRTFGRLATVDDFAITLSFGGEQNRLNERKSAGGLIKGHLLRRGERHWSAFPVKEPTGELSGFALSAGIRRIDGGLRHRRTYLWARRVNCGCVSAIFPCPSGTLCIMHVPECGTSYIPAFPIEAFAWQHALFWSHEP